MNRKCKSCGKSVKTVVTSTEKGYTGTVQNCIDSCSSCGHKEFYGNASPDYLATPPMSGNIEE